MLPGQANTRSMKTDSCNQGIRGDLESKFEENEFGGCLLADPAAPFQQLLGNQIDG